MSVPQLAMPVASMSPDEGRTKVATAETAAELLAHYGQVETFRPKAVVQEVIVGTDDAKFCYLAVYGSNGARLGHLVVHELRCQPIRVGSASVVEPVVDEEPVEAAAANGEWTYTPMSDWGLDDRR